ncbi:MalY/PatB family protein [Allorhizobium taibaishanense]|uniref:cysteine-S-conjugate beta-lyase n=1 Tax=Allorhizobium taibaishanense TaxID=887144 RepID=A0A1Q9A9C1_9HYPH|nr:MalY/PatB family protein [Allorhizobium taibaishanense]MBB4009788.1 cystathionine beta-lyase [Allorhizobium taibaishanense]OLP51437.1 aspartate aminotransferase [Allorhizobium taibaishanense]
MYNFDEIFDRRRSNCMKWSQNNSFLSAEQRQADPLPMWVADMDFRVAQPILDALQEEVAFGIFGYGEIPASCIEAVVDWQTRRFGWQPKAEWVVQTPGVVSALSATIQAFTQPGDFVLVQSPVYFHIHHDVMVNGRRVIHAPLTLEGDQYRFDPVAFEAAIKPGTKLFILCNPHNPTGKVFGREELEAMAAICERHGILVLSDEIHEDLILDPEKRHVPFAMVSEAAADIAIICTAPSKTFNIAGLQCANVFIPNARRRAEFRARCEKNGLIVMNTMGVAACEAAYQHCEPWADAMLDYVRANQLHFASRIQALDLPIRATPADALYLAWIDFRDLAKPTDELHDFLLRQARLWLDPGTKFGPGGEGFMRINLACPRSLVDEAIERLYVALRR